MQLSVEADHQEPGADEPDAGYAQPVAAARTGTVSHLSAPQAHPPGPERRRRPNAIAPASTPIPTRPTPAAANGPPIVVDVAPSPVPGTPEGVAGGLEGAAGGLEGVTGGLEGVAEGVAAGWTTSVAVPELPFEQSMDGLYVPGAMFFGRSTVVLKPPASVDACIGICADSPSVAPNKVADVAEEPQVTLNVTLAPGVAVDGVTSIGGTDANAGAAVSTTAPASVSAAPAQQMRRNGLPSRSGRVFPPTPAGHYVPPHLGSTHPCHISYPYAY